MPSAAASHNDLERLLTTGFAARAIRQKASQLVARAGFSPSDQEDLEQELRLHLLCRLSKFDPDVAHWNVFVRTLVERHAATLVTQRRVRIRAVSEDLHQVATSTPHVDLTLDMADIVARLSPCDRELCQQLKRQSVAAVARQKGIARSTLRDEIGRLGERLVAMGLEDFSRTVRHLGLDAGR